MSAAHHGTRIGRTIPLVSRPSVPPVAAPAIPTWRRLAIVPHRLFFLGAVSLLAVAALAWLCAIASRVLPLDAPPLATAQPVWHALAMLSTFIPFFVFGFTYTAGPKWLAVEPPGPRVFAPLGVAAWIGAVLMLVAPAGFETIARAGALLLAAAWLGLAFVFARLVVRSAAKDKVHATLVLVALVAGATAPLAFAIVGAVAWRWIVFAGVWLFALPVFVVVCHRMIPFFTANVLPTVGVFRPWWLLAALVAGPVLHGVLAATLGAPWTLVVDAPVALLAFDLARRWGLAQSFTNRLLAMLHVGFVWYAIGFALFALDAAAVLLNGAPWLGLAPLHALTIGFAGSLMLAMVTRVSYSHSGRTLAADRVVWALFLLLQGAALVRVAAEIAVRGPLLALSALLFAAALLAWIARMAPLYWRPRADGRPG